jgi:hypothetical protein
MKITSFDKQNLTLVRAAIDSALKKIADEFDLAEISIGNISFDRQGIYFSTKLEATVKADNNHALVEQHKKNSEYCGYNENIVGRVATIKGEPYKITGFNMKKRKYPIEAENLKTNKKGYGLPAGVAIEGVIFDRSKSIFS